MPKDFLKNAKDHYDVVVIGSGLGGMTAANVLARQGRRVLLLEQHYKLGGMATSYEAILELPVNQHPNNHELLAQLIDAEQLYRSNRRMNLCMVELVQLGTGG